MYFADRKDAGRELAHKLEKYRGSSPVVLGLARGGVPVAAGVAAYLEAPLDVLVVRKVGAPFQPELAIGALAGDLLWLNRPLIAALDISVEQVDRAVARERVEVERRETLYRLGRPAVALEGHIAIVVDDGLATGATAVAALHALRRKEPKAIIFAAPVCSHEGADLVAEEADDVVCLEHPADFYAVSQAYGSFAQVSDEEVRETLEAAAPA
ncbi:MAG TPA: phosphoribosyltransferase family protein [Gemmatimonadales bacterium]|nr:phosphoribosyltransferase family protein [Gemmatimonadales bacterium]